MDVTVIGCGYVGLVTGTCLASIGHTVRGVEKDLKKLKTLQDGHCPIFEPGLHELMQENYASGQLQFTDDVKAAVKDAEVVFLCVGTPPKPDPKDQVTPASRDSKSVPAKTSTPKPEEKTAQDQLNQTAADQGSHNNQGNNRALHESPLVSA